VITHSYSQTDTFQLVAFVRRFHVPVHSTGRKYPSAKHLDMTEASVDAIICLFELNLVVSSPLRCLLRVTVCYGRRPQVVLYILAVFCFQFGSSLDIGIRANYLLKIKFGGATCSPLTRVVYITADLNTVVQFKNKFRTLVLTV
jgi:hypothetical protein